VQKHQNKQESGMKKTFAICTAAAAFAAISFAQEDSNTVSSANVVGYNKVNIPSNDYALVSTSFLSTNNTIEGIFSDLPTGSMILFWDSEKQGYTSVSKTFSQGWGDSGTNVIERGSGVFVKLPAGVDAVELTLSGDVPTDEDVSFFIQEGYKLLSYPYPSDVPFGETALATNSLTGDIISFWDNGWKSYSKTFSKGWGDFATNTLSMGQAFFYRSSATTQVNEPKPYELN
jgi:hypothetical protein